MRAGDRRGPGVARGKRRRDSGERSPSRWAALRSERCRRGARHRGGRSHGPRPRSRRQSRPAALCETAGCSPEPGRAHGQGAGLIG